MKLKKIVSLALAGILAVSMLTACGDKGSSSSTTEPEVTPTTGAAAAVNAELDKNKDKISFSTDKQLDDAMKIYFEANPIKADYWKNLQSEEMKIQAGSINDIVGATYTTVDALETMVAKKTETKKESGLIVYAFNAKWFNKDAVLKYVGKIVDNLNLAEDASNATGDGKEYVYSGVASVLEVKSEGGAQSLWVVGLKITKDYTNV